MLPEQAAVLTADTISTKSVVTPAPCDEVVQLELAPLQPSPEQDEQTRCESSMLSGTTASLPLESVPHVVEVAWAQTAVVTHQLEQSRAKRSWPETGTTCDGARAVHMSHNLPPMPRAGVRARFEMLAVTHAQRLLDPAQGGRKQLVREEGLLI